MIKKALFGILMLSACQNQTIQMMPNLPDFIDVKQGKGETVIIAFNDQNKSALLAEIQKHQGHIVQEYQDFKMMAVSLPFSFIEIKKRLETINGISVIKNVTHSLHN